MTDEEKEKYIEGMSNFKRATLFSAAYKAPLTPEITDFFSMLPAKLYKYRRFNKWWREPIEEGYLYLAAANMLDDPFECLVDMDVTNYCDKDGNISKEALYPDVMRNIMRFVTPGSRAKTAELSRSILDGDTTDGHREIKIGSQSITVNEAKYLADIGDKVGRQFWDKNNISLLNRLIKTLSESPSKIGICSLAEESTDQVMWAMYASNYEGFCIEYDFEHSVEAAIDTFPALYSDGRNNNIIRLIAEFLCNMLVERISNHKIQTSASSFYKIYLTKSLEWSFQKEWRVLGDADKKVPAPRITAVYIGHKAKRNNVRSMLKLSREKGFKVFKTKINSSTLKIEFVEITELPKKEKVL